MTHHLKFNKKLSLSVALPVLAFALGLPAMAQERDDEEQNGLDTITVTAQKREENIQDVPVSVGTLSTENLEAVLSAGVDILGLSARVPSLFIETSNGRVAPRFYIRGLGNTVFDANASQPVSFVYDDVVLENVSAKAFPIFDIATTEVLRGPQGTLFGRNTPAGVVKLESVRPDQETDGYIALQGGRFGQRRVDAALGGALTPSLSARVSLLYRGLSDYIDNNAAGLEVEDQAGGYDEFAARVQFLWEPSDATSILFNGGYQNLENSGGTFRAQIFQEGVGFIGTDRRSTSQDTLATAGQDLEQFYLTGKLVQDFGSLTLTSITGYRDITNNVNQGDVDGGSLTGPIFPGNIPFVRDVLGGGQDIGLETGDNVAEHSQFSQELRLASNNSSPFNWILGFYYFNEDVRIDSFNNGGISSTSFFGSSTDPNIFGGLDGQFPLPPPALFQQQFQDTESFAFFGTAFYDLTDRLSVQGGIRYSSDDKDYTVVFTPANFLAPATGAFPAVTDDDEVTGDFSFRYAVSDNVNFFGRYARGYRASSILSRDSFPSIGDAETINSYEAGIKSILWDNTLRFNVTGYVYDVSDLQLAVVGGATNTIGLINADNVNGHGIELDVEYAPTQNVLFTFGTSWNSTAIDDPNLGIQACGDGCTVLDPENPAIPGQFLIDGNSLPNAPEWILNTTLRLSQPAFNGEVYFLTDWFYRSSVNPFLYESIEFEFDGRVEGGLRVGYITGDRRWEMGAYVRNVTNELDPIAALDFINFIDPVSGDSFFTGSQSEPRFWGFDVKYNF